MGSPGPRAEAPSACWGWGRVGEEGGLGRGRGFQGCVTKRLTQLGPTGGIFQLGLERIHLVFNSFVTSSLLGYPIYIDLEDNIGWKSRLGQK